MGRRIIYRINDLPENSIEESEWEEVQRLQHWYNSEFHWTTGRLSFRRYVMFPNVEEFSDLDRSIWEIICERRSTLRGQGLSEVDIVSQLEKDHLVSVKWGGYFEDCLASGFTRVADNEWNAYLVCDFILKASTVMRGATICVLDEGRFVKTRRVSIRDGIVLLSGRQVHRSKSLEQLVEHRRIFSIVDPERYTRHPALKNNVPQFNDMRADARRALVRNWNWLGYGNKYDHEDDEAKGYDLNMKVRRFEIVDELC